MPTEPNLTNTPEDRRVADSGNLRSRLLKKEDSRLFEPEELAAKSHPAMFQDDWQPVMVGDVFTAKPIEEVQHQEALKAQQTLAAEMEKTHAKDLKFLKIWAMIIGGCVLLGLAVVAIVKFKN